MVHVSQADTKYKQGEYIITKNLVNVQVRLMVIKAGRGGSCTVYLQ